MARDAIRRIVDYNKGRDPELLARKFERMRRSPFVFFRGSCHLFYEDWPPDSKLDRAPLGWISGDLHLENFGVYKGDNRLVYFDLNDFDEAALAPCTWELARFATSLLLAAGEAGLSAAQGRHLVEAYLVGYREALAEGKARWVEQAIAEGEIKALLDDASARARADFLDRRTERRSGMRRIRVDGEHALPASQPARSAVARLVMRFGRDCGSQRYFKVLDVARRIAGTGSLGRERYVVLVEGKGSPDQNLLIDLKLAIPAVPARHWRRIQPRWVSDAQRIVQVQKRAQAVSPAFLSAVEIDGKPFVLRELQPREDRLDLDGLVHKGRFEEVVATMGRATAWSHLRSSGRQGAAIADDWIGFSAKENWVRRLIDYSRDYRRVVERDWKAARQALTPVDR